MPGPLRTLSACAVTLPTTGVGVLIGLKVAVNAVGGTIGVRDGAAVNVTSIGVKVDAGLVDAGAEVEEATKDCGGCSGG